MTTAVRFDVPAEVAFDYLVDPRNRPQWQSSLRRIEGLTTEVPAVGQAWIDVTAPGPRPAMETTTFERPTTWTERGTWRGISAELTLTFVDRPGGCAVLATASVRGRGALRPLGPAITRAAGLAVPGDLKRAARILSERASEQ
ncbi:MAG: hypothetical protein JWP74_805 [Marmoricola sp.]|nr:hypothetical protein [Marmoricola sp.]